MSRDSVTRLKILSMSLRWLKIKCIITYTFTCTDDVIWLISKHCMLPAYANNYHVICDITVRWDIEWHRRTKLHVTIVGFEPRTQQIISVVVSSRIRSFQVPILQFNLLRLHVHVLWSCSWTLCTISKTRDQFLAVLVNIFIV